MMVILIDLREKLRCMAIAQTDMFASSAIGARISDSGACLLATHSSRFASSSFDRLRSKVPRGIWPALRAISSTRQSVNPSDGRFTSLPRAEHIFYLTKNPGPNGLERGRLGLASTVCFNRGRAHRPRLPHLCWDGCECGRRSVHSQPERTPTDMPSVWTSSDGSLK